MELARRSLGATLLHPPLPHHHIFIKIPLFKPKDESVILGVYNTSKIHKKHKAKKKKMVKKMKRNGRNKY
jgi:hypothetical protein